jgi:hypothetical protein
LHLTDRDRIGRQAVSGKDAETSGRVQDAASFQPANGRRLRGRLPMLQVFQMARGAKAEMNEALTMPQKVELDELESVISRGLKTFNQVGAALLRIRDMKLYKAEYGTFEDYCRDRWGMSIRRAYQLVDAAMVMENVNNCTQTPATESQARPLAKLPPEQQADAWLMDKKLLTIADNETAKIRNNALLFHNMLKSR